MDNPEKLATGRRITKRKHNALCGEDKYSQANTNNVNKSWVLLQTTIYKTYTYN